MTAPIGYLAFNGHLRNSGHWNCFIDKEAGLDTTREKTIVERLMLRVFYLSAVDIVSGGKWPL